MKLLRRLCGRRPLAKRAIPIRYSDEKHHEAQFENVKSGEMARRDRPAVGPRILQLVAILQGTTASVVTDARNRVLRRPLRENITA
jgi:hypothetical protein